jgi:ribosomal protein S18 acetylase RimI-like enzyme/O-methyltransferase involved in polyketide biosynthesis
MSSGVKSCWSSTSSVEKTAFDALQAKQSAVVAGYDPIVVENRDVYEQLLLRAINPSSAQGGCEKEAGEEKSSSSKRNNPTKPRRQTPLVNAGYASRVLSISHSIRSFILYHKLISSSSSIVQQKQQRRRIRIVFLGCGVDVIGLWARCLPSSLSVTIIEVDTPEVCSIKRKMLSDRGMVNNLTEHCHRGRDDVVDGTNSNATTKTKESESESGSTLYYKGKIVHPSSANDTDDDYVLVPADLNDTSTLEIILDEDNNEEDDDIPTLVISELVLCYLPPPSTDRLLKWCSDRLCRTPDSALISLEPLGFDNSTTSSSTARTSGDDDGIISVEDGYRREYCQKFDDKMKRGKSSTTTTMHTGTTNRNYDDVNQLSYSSDSLFHPIGTSIEKVSSRIRRVGFSEASSATSLGVVASVAAAAAASTNSKSKTFICPETFDEHAALVLHLQSYVFSCGLTGNNPLFRRLLCPWEQPNAFAFVRAGLPIIDPRKGIVYTEIEIIDESQVRNMFQTAYDSYTEEYPAIRKMVKGVLNKDLRETETTTATTVIKNDYDGNIDSDDSCLKASAISNFYRSSGGIFLVAVRYTDSSSMKHDGDDDNEDMINNIGLKRRRHVVGCVGIRSCEAKDVDASRTLEIFRLAVDARARGQGIARNLLQAAELYAQEQRRNKCLRFVASTLTILDAAAGLYESCGYQAEKDIPLGSRLVMRTYIKESLAS